MDDTSDHRPVQRRPPGDGTSADPSLEMLQFAAQAADIGIWHWDLVANQVSWDARCGQLYGYEDGEPVSYAGFLKRITPEDRQRVNKTVQTSLRERTDYMAEMRIMQPDGSLRWVMSKGRGFYDSEGRPTSMHGITLDITERKQAEASLRESEEKFSKAFQAAPSMFSISTLAGKYLDINQSFLSTLHYRREEVIGHTAQELGIWEDPAERDRLIAILQRNGTVRNFEIRLRDRNGGVITGLVSTELITIQGQECLLTVTRDITEFKKAEHEREQSILELKQAEQEIRTLNRELAAKASELAIKAAHDSLTGLWNHEEIIEILNHELARADREGKCVSAIMADIDFFKQVNDTYGHVSGDEVLRQTARKISSNVRSYDFVGRYGGEEFLLILPECDQSCSLSFAERIRTSISGSLISIPEGTIPVTISMGVAQSCKNRRRDATSLLKASDAALYMAKRKGRNRVELAPV